MNRLTVVAILAATAAAVLAAWYVHGAEGKRRTARAASVTALGFAIAGAIALSSRVVRRSVARAQVDDNAAQVVAAMMA